jgi:hypothetical protein
VVELCFQDSYELGNLKNKNSARNCSIEKLQIFEAILSAQRPLTAKEISTITKMDIKTVLKILKNDQLCILPFFEKLNITGGFRWSVSKGGIENIKNCKSSPSIDLSNLQQKAKQLMELDFSEKLQKEKDMLIGKKGIEKFFTPDMSNPNDREILFRLRNKYQKYPVGEEML